MEDSGKNWVINQEIARKKGKRFSQYFEEKSKKTQQTLKIGDNIVLDEKELDNLTGADY